MTLPDEFTIPDDKYKLISAVHNPCWSSRNSANFK